MKVHNVNPNEPLFHDESGAAAFAEQLQELIGPVRTFFVDEEMEFDRTIFGNITYDMRLVRIQRMVLRLQILRGICGVEHDLLGHQLFVVFVIPDDMNNGFVPPPVCFISDVLGNLLPLVFLAADFCPYSTELMKPIGRGLRQALVIL